MWGSREMEESDALWSQEILGGVVAQAKLKRTCLKRENVPDVPATPWVCLTYGSVLLSKGALVQP